MASVAAPGPVGKAACVFIGPRSIERGGARCRAGLFVGRRAGGATLSRREAAVEVARRRGGGLRRLLPCGPGGHRHPCRRPAGSRGPAGLSGGAPGGDLRARTLGRAAATRAVGPYVLSAALLLRPRRAALSVVRPAPAGRGEGSAGDLRQWTADGVQLPRPRELRTLARGGHRGRRRGLSGPDRG